MRKLNFIIAAGLSLSLVAGCSGPISVDVISRLTGAVGPIQTQPQELPPVLVQEGDTILIDDRVTVIDNPSQDIIVAELPNQTILGFENDTGWDIYLQYYADGELQAVYVYDGETLLLEYPCLSDLELIGEDHIDPNTGLLVDSFDLTGTNFFNPDDFICGDAFILNFDPYSINARTEVVDLRL